MRKALNLLFGAAAFAACWMPIQARADQMKEVVVIVLYDEGQPVQGKVIGVEPSKSCAEVLAKVLAETKERGLDVWAKCVKVDRVPPLKKERDS